MSFASAFDAFITTFLGFIDFCDGIYPFTDFPQLSLFWLMESLIITNIAWQLFPDEVNDNFGDNE